MIGPASATWTRRNAAALSLSAALAVSLAAYWRVLHGPFLFDDAWVVAQNLSIKSADALVRFLRTSTVTERPVATITFALNYAAGRLDTFGYHLANVLVHLATAFLLFRLGRTLLMRAGAPSSAWVAAAAAGAFALHPLNSQAVAYVTQRGESLSALFAVATQLLLLAAERASSIARRMVWATVATATFVLGLETKLVAIVAPVLWAIGAFALPLSEEDGLRRRVRRVAPMLAPFLLVGGALSIATFARLRGHADVGLDIPGLGPWTYLLTQGHAVLLYARLLLLPVGQSIDHDLRLATGLDAATSAAGALLMGALALGCWLLFRPPRSWTPEGRASGRAAGLGIVWWFVCLAPSSSLIPVRDLAVEHRAYLANFGLLLALAVGLERAVARLGPQWRPRVGGILIVTLWLALALTLHRRNAVWESELALWADAAAKAPSLIRPTVNAAYARQKAGDLDGAIEGYRRALSLPEDPVQTRARIRFYLGSALVLRHRPAEAYDVLIEALTSDPWNPELLNGLAIASLDLGRPSTAERLASAAMTVDPTFGKAFNTLGEAYLALGRTEAALGAFTRAASLDPDSARRQYNVAITAFRLGRREDGCAAVARYRLTPGDAALDAEIAAVGTARGCPVSGGAR